MFSFRQIIVSSAYWLMINYFSNRLDTKDFDNLHNIYIDTDKINRPELIGQPWIVTQAKMASTERWGFWTSSFITEILYNN